MFVCITLLWEKIVRKTRRPINSSIKWQTEKENKKHLHMRKVILNFIWLWQMANESCRICCRNCFRFLLGLVWVNKHAIHIKCQPTIFLFHSFVYSQRNRNGCKAKIQCNFKWNLVLHAANKKKTPMKISYELWKVQKHTVK